MIGKVKHLKFKILHQVELSMVAAMKVQFTGCLSDPGNLEDHSSWARRWPVQIMLAAARCKWTTSVEASLKSPNRFPLQNLLNVLQVCMSHTYYITLLCK
jgi:hypothetical protein